MTDPLPAEIATALAAPSTRPRLGSLARRIDYYLTTSSSNDRALAAAAAGAPDGTVVVAGRQTAGRGRRGRSWDSPPGAGLYVSVLLGRATTPLVTLLAGVAAAEALRAVAAVPVELEWPNDLVIPSPRAAPTSRAKLGGILSEVAAADDPSAPSAPRAGARVVVGIGINLTDRAFPPDLRRPATALARHTSVQPTAGEVLVEVLAGLRAWSEHVAREGPASMLRRWSELSPSSRSHVVAWTTSRGRVEGVTAGIDAEGALRVTVGDVTERIVSGTLEWGPAVSDGAPAQGVA